MSYILDALRKADAQRESDPARGIHAQPVRVGTGDSPPSDGTRIGYWAASAAGVAAVACLLGWYFYRDGGAVAVAPPVQTEVALAPAPAIVDPPATAPAAAVLPPPVLTPPPVVVAPPIPATPPVVQVRAVEPPAATPPARTKVGGSARKARLAADSEADPSVQSAAPAAAAPPPAAAPGAVPAPVVAVAAAPVAGLPADAPKLAISGGVYSVNAAQRMLIVNGQVFNEGGEVGPGVMLEEIKPKGAVLKFRGARYSVSY